MQAVTLPKAADVSLPKAADVSWPKAAEASSLRVEGLRQHDMMKTGTAPCQ